MEEYIGLDVSMKETAVAIRRDGVRVWRGKCTSDPHIIADLIRKRAPTVRRVVFETGPLSVWFYHALGAEGLPLLDAWKGLRARAADLGRKLVANARQSQACRILMSIPGVGAITATSFATAIEEPGNFQEVTICRCMDRSYDAPLPVRRSRL